MTAAASMVVVVVVEEEEEGEEEEEEKRARLRKSVGNILSANGPRFKVAFSFESFPRKGYLT